MRAHRCALICVAMMVPQSAFAGAWTLPEGSAQLIESTYVSRAMRAYDTHGSASTPIRFDKFYTQLYAQYGWSDSLTLLAAPEYENAKWRSPGAPADGKRDFAFAGGLQYRLLDRFGVASISATVKTAGAHDTSAASDGASGRQIELRLLYGTNFRLFGRPGFADIEAGQRWIQGPRPDETPIDVTLGLHVRPRFMVLIQSFNVIAGGDGSPDFGYYRSHKVQVSFVRDLWRGTSLQLGGFLSPAGQNNLGEEGLMAGFWARF